MEPQPVPPEEGLGRLLLPIQVEQRRLARICHGPVHDLHPRRQLVRFDFAAGSYVLNGNIVGHEMIAEQPPMAVLVVALGAHDRGAAVLGDVQQLSPSA